MECFGYMLLKDGIGTCDYHLLIRYLAYHLEPNVPGLCQRLGCNDMQGIPQTWTKDLGSWTDLFSKLEAVGQPADYARFAEEYTGAHEVPVAFLCSFCECLSQYGQAFTPAESPVHTWATFILGIESGAFPRGNRPCTQCPTYHTPRVHTYSRSTRTVHSARMVSTSASPEPTVAPPAAAAKPARGSLSGSDDEDVSELTNRVESTKVAAADSPLKCIFVRAAMNSRHAAVAAALVHSGRGWWKAYERWFERGYAFAEPRLKKRCETYLSQRKPLDLDEWSTVVVPINVVEVIPRVGRFSIELKKYFHPKAYEKLCRTAPHLLAMYMFMMHADWYDRWAGPPRMTMVMKEELSHALEASNATPRLDSALIKWMMG